MLDTNGFKTISAKNGAEALGLLRTIIPDLIIADILMPVMDGFTLCRECKKDEILKNIPFFFYTATYIDAKDEEYALSLGADRFILKPQEPDVFLNIINNFLEEVKKKTVHSKEIIQQTETVVLKEYNEVLIRKIEDKMLQTEKSEKELRKYAEKLENEILEHKKSEDSLRKSEEYNRMLFTTSPIGLALCRMDGSLIDINPAYAKIIGRTIEETLKLTYWDITPEKYKPQEAEQLKSLEETGYYGKYEKEYIHKDGHLVPVLLQGLILERNGERFVWSSVEDISKRKEAEIALQKSQHLFQTLAQASPVGIFRTDPNGDTTYVNPKWMELSGLSFEEALGNGWLNSVHPEDRGKVSESWINNLKSQNESSDEYRFLRPDGSIAWVIGKAVPEMIKNEVVAYVGTITDITEHKRAEETLLESEKKYRQLVTQSPDGIFITNFSGKFLSVNRSICENLKYTEEELLTLKVQDIVPEKYHSLYKRRLTAILNGESTNTYAEYEVRGKDGVPHFVEIISVPYYKGKEIIGFQGIARDITQRKKAEEELIKAKDKAEESDRLKTAFLHNISHEVRTPMNAIVGFSDLIIDPDLTPEIRNEFLQTIVQASNQLLSIITQIVSMATIEAGQEKIYEKEISLNSILKMLFEQFTSEAGRKNISLKYNTALPDSEAKIKTDETKLIQIISNLLSNAFKFIKLGSINFGYVLKDKYLEFYVKDTGIGIPEDLHENIFERFRQVETTLAREYEGSGLGLSISKAYVELLGGKIWLTSTLGEGSVFYFTIPYNKVSLNKIPEKGVAGKYKSELKKTITLLVAEDENINFKLLAQYLSNSNIVVIYAENGSEAVEICKKNSQINLVLMDLKMPVMDGFEATKRIKEFRPDLPVIAQTAYVRDVDKTKAFACGCSDFLSKPFMKEELLTMIREHMVFD
jgi:PAS domain S-box-containing protein